MDSELERCEDALGLCLRLGCPALSSQLESKLFRLLSPEEVQVELWELSRRSHGLLLFRRSHMDGYERYAGSFNEGKSSVISGLE